MPFITLCYHYFVNNVQNTFSFELARHWMKERGISCMVLSVEFIYLTARVAGKWVKERGITHFTQLWGTTKSPIRSRLCPPNHRTWRRASTQTTRKSILSLDTNLKTKGIYQCRVSPRSQETSNDSSDGDAAYTDEPLADAEWIEKYQEE